MFYDYEIFKMVKSVVENEIGQEISTWVKGTSFEGDIQPALGTFKATMGWGDDVKGELTLYTDEPLQIGDRVDYGGVYEIEKLVKWDYYIYSLKRVD